MPTLYLTEQGAVLRKEGRRLIVEKDGERLLDVPLIKLESVLIYGNVQFSTQTLSTLLGAGIETSFLAMDGRLKGQLVPPKAKNVVLRMAQYDRAHDPAFCLRVAKAIVRRKIENAFGLVRRFNYRYPDRDFSRAYALADRILTQLERKTRANTVLGLEGVATAEYFKCLSAMFIADLRFLGRNRRPPQDEVNALLSFGYVLVGNEVSSLLHAMGFDPYIGFLHHIDYGRHSLALDLLEEFRGPVVDRLVLYLANKRILQRRHFERRDGGVYLTSEGLKIFLKEYERWMTRSNKDRQCFRDALKHQATVMARAVREGGSYVPYRFL